ncbi:hypothetical protein ACVWXO_004054 [Bradyrhizobium sp. LM2.7]
MIESISAVTLAAPTCRAPSTSTRGLGFESVHGGEAVEFTSFLAGRSFLRRESRKRLVMLGPEANQMTTSKTIAGLIGPTLVAIAAGMLLNIGSFPELAEQVFPRPRAHLRVRCPLVRRRTCHCARSQSLDEGMAGARDHPWLACHPQRPCTNAFPNRPGRNCRRNWSGHRRDHSRSHRDSGARRLPLVQGIST